MAAVFLVPHHVDSLTFLESIIYKYKKKRKQIRFWQQIVFFFGPPKRNKEYNVLKTKKFGSITHTTQSEKIGWGFLTQLTYGLVLKSTSVGSGYVCTHRLPRVGAVLFRRVPFVFFAFSSTYRCYCKKKKYLGSSLTGNTVRGLLPVATQFLMHEAIPTGATTRVTKWNPDSKNPIETTGTFLL